MSELRASYSGAGYGKGDNEGVVLFSLSGNIL